MMREYSVQVVTRMRTICDYGLGDSRTAASGYWLLTIFYIITSIITELLSNSATVVLLIPIAAKVAEQLSFNPIAFIFAVTFAASNSFMTPIGYQANTMVYGPGGYKFTDFVRLGLPLNILMTVITPPLIILFYGL